MHETRVATAAITKSATRSALEDAGCAFVLAAAIVMLVRSGPTSVLLGHWSGAVAQRFNARPRKSLNKHTSCPARLRAMPPHRGERGRKRAGVPAAAREPIVVQSITSAH
jgi:hypothetical protein